MKLGWHAWLFSWGKYALARLLCLVGEKHKVDYPCAMLKLPVSVSSCCLNLEFYGGFMRLLWLDFTVEYTQSCDFQVLCYIGVVLSVTYFYGN